MPAGEKEILDCLQLAGAAGVGPVTFLRLLDKFGSPAAALEALPEDKKVFSRSQAARELDKARRKNIRLIPFTDSDYPVRLRSIPDAPPLIYVRGRTDILDAPLSLAVVGARNASVNGRKLASKIAYDLTESGVVIISGMARGIDSSAHKGAMYAQNRAGPTVAVLGTGADIPYPAENSLLYEQICAQGAVVSEFPLGTEAQPNNFPRRNRIVSALSSGTLVVEATLHSGSLITAKMALEQGRDVFAVPGSPAEGRSLGPNRLIKDGAVLAESADDILNVLQMTAGRSIPLSLSRPPQPAENTAAQTDGCSFFSNRPEPAAEHQKSLFYQNGHAAYLSRREEEIEFLASGGRQSEQSAAHKNSSARRITQKELCRNSLDKVENNADIPQQPTDDITDYLSAEGVCVDEIIRASGLTPAEVSLKLLELEMQGRIERQIGNKVALIKR